MAMARSSRSTPITWRAPASSKARVSPPGPGPISMVVPMVRSPAPRAMRPVRLRSNRKCWPSDFFASSPWAAMTWRSGGKGDVESAMGAALRHLGRQLQRRDQTVGARLAGAGQTEGGAVIGRGADEGQAEGDIDPAMKIERLDRDQHLVVIHAERHVIGRPRFGMEQGIARQRPSGVDAFGLQRGDGG